MEDYLLMGMMLAYGKLNEFNLAEEVLESLDPELWLETEIININQIKEILYARGIDVHDFEENFGV